MVLICALNVQNFTFLKRTLSKHLFPSKEAPLDAHARVGSHFALVLADAPGRDALLADDAGKQGGVTERGHRSHSSARRHDMDCVSDQRHPRRRLPRRDVGVRRRHP